MQFIHGSSRALASLVSCAALLSMAACTSASSEDSCARRIELNGLRYTDVGGTKVTIANNLGKVSFLPCADVDDGDQPEQTNVYEIQGLNQQIAVAVGASAKEAELFALEQTGGGLPDEVQQFIDREKE